MGYQIDDDDMVTLRDEGTGRNIMNCTKIVGDELLEKQLRGGRDADSQRQVVIDVRRPLPQLGNDGIAFKLDHMPEGLREEVKTAKVIVQYASAIAVALEAGGNDAVIYCNNGRSRSPTVVAAFFIIYRGYSFHRVKRRFKTEYPRQRPKTAEASNNFPNLEKFERVLTLLAKCLAEPAASVRNFNLAGESNFSHVSVHLQCFLIHIISSECVAGCSAALGYSLILAKPSFEPATHQTPCRATTRSWKRNLALFGEDVLEVGKGKCRFSPILPSGTRINAICRNRCRIQLKKQSANAKGTTGKDKEYDAVGALLRWQLAGKPKDENGKPKFASAGHATEIVKVLLMEFGSYDVDFEADTWEGEMEEFIRRRGRREMAGTVRLF